MHPTYSTLLYPTLPYPLRRPSQQPTLEIVTDTRQELGTAFLGEIVSAMGWDGMGWDGMGWMLFISSSFLFFFFFFFFFAGIRHTR